jgi:hypothetical protein
VQQALKRGRLTQSLDDILRASDRCHGDAESTLQGVRNKLASDVTWLRNRLHGARTELNKLDDDKFPLDYENLEKAKARFERLEKARYDLSDFIHKKMV